MAVKLVIELADAPGLGDVLAELGDWYGGRRIYSDGVVVTICSGSQYCGGPHQFAWRVTDIEVAEENNTAPHFVDGRPWPPG
jgi:hypothetical protein